MSTHYSIFLECDDFTNEILPALAILNGVEYKKGQLQIHGMSPVEFHELDASHRVCMKEDYGQLGIDVNWEICGRHDKETDIFGVVSLLLNCAATIISMFPDRCLSVMRNGESFYLHNTEGKLIISPYYSDESQASLLFDKSFTIEHIEYSAE